MLIQWFEYYPEIRRRSDLGAYLMRSFFCGWSPGGWLIAVVMIGVDPGAFWGQMSSGVDFRDDILNGITKSCIFGIAITQIALTWVILQNQRRRVSSATTSCVVISAFAILGLDFILTAFMFNN